MTDAPAAPAPDAPATASVPVKKINLALQGGGAHGALEAHFDDIGVRSTFDLRAEAQAEWA